MLGVGGIAVSSPVPGQGHTEGELVFVTGWGWGLNGSPIFHPPICGGGSKQHPLPIEAVCWRPQPARWAQSGCGSLWGLGTVTVLRDFSCEAPAGLAPGAGQGAPLRLTGGSLRARRRGLQVTCSCSSGDPRAL